MFLKWNAFTFFRLLYCFFFIITSLYFTILDYFYLTEFIPSFTFDLFFIFPTVSHIYFPSFSFHLRSSIFPYIFFFLVYCWRPSLFISFILIIHTQLSYRFLFFPFSPLTSCFFFFLIPSSIFILLTSSFITLSFPLFHQFIVFPFLPRISLMFFSKNMLWRMQIHSS